MIDDADTAARGGVSVDGKDASEVPFHRRGFFLGANEQGLHRLEWRLEDRLNLLPGAQRSPRGATQLDMVDPRCAGQAAGHARPWCLADARRRASESGKELAGVAAMGAPRGARASRVKGPMRASRPHACVLDGKGVVFEPFLASARAAGWVRPYAVVGRFPLRQGDR